MTKNPVGRPEKEDSEKVKSVSRLITFQKSTFEMMEKMKGHEKNSSFIDRMIRELYNNPRGELESTD